VLTAFCRNTGHGAIVIFKNIGGGANRGKNLRDYEK